MSKKTIKIMVVGETNSGKTTTAMAIALLAKQAGLEVKYDVPNEVGLNKKFLANLRDSVELVIEEVNANRD